MLPFCHTLPDLFINRVSSLSDSCLACPRIIKLINYYQKYYVLPAARDIAAWRQTDSLYTEDKQSYIIRKDFFLERWTKLSNKPFGSLKSPFNRFSVVCELHLIDSQQVLLCVVLLLPVTNFTFTWGCSNWPHWEAIWWVFFFAVICQWHVITLSQSVMPSPLGQSMPPSIPLCRTFLSVKHSTAISTYEVIFSGTRFSILFSRSIYRTFSYAWPPAVLCYFHLLHILTFLEYSHIPLLITISILSLFLS